MTKAEIIEFINANPTCYLATAEGTRPRVRAMRMVLADEKGLLFQTVEGKALPKQLMANPDVEVCYFSAEKGIQIRIWGKAVFIDDDGLKKEIVEQRPFVKPMIKEKGFGAMPVFRVVECMADVWTRATNMAPREPVRF